MKKAGFVLTVLSIVFLFGSCKIGRYVWYNFSDITDYKIFPSRPLHGSDTPFRFFDAQNNMSIENNLMINDHAGV